MSALKTNQHENDDNSWNSWSKHIIRKLEEFDSCYREVKQGQVDILVELAMLKVKIGVWGFAGSAFGFFVAWAVTKL